LSDALISQILGDSMKVKSMLMRLQTALQVENLSEQMLLIPGETILLTDPAAPAQKSKVTPRSKVTTIVIGYNDSPNSRTALDFALWMAHQTRLASRTQVMVHVVYVLNQEISLGQPSRSSGAGTATLTRPVASVAGVREITPAVSLNKLLEEGDRILWQARSLGEQWRGSLEAHLCFGDVATELCRIVEAESADILFVGCSSDRHPLIQQLTPRFPCPVLGIPTELEAL
jgi:nucleotide-binding universal stress UspA family protein